MAEFRKDPIVDRWVLVAPGRSARPQEFVETETVRRTGPCPFCAGNEAATTAEIDAIREPESAPSGPGWRVRAVANKYPFLDSNSTVERRGSSPPFCEQASEQTAGMNPAARVQASSPLFVSRPAAGAHEVLIEAPHHAVRAADLTDAATTELLQLYRARLRTLRRDPQVRYVQIFKNVGEAAGASIEHLHSQLAALDEVPETVAAEIAGVREHRQRTGRCLFCDVIAAELAAATRIVESTPDFVVACPYASRFSYEMHLWPRRHAGSFDALSDDELARLGALLRRTLLRVEALADRQAYNVLLHTAPFDSFSREHYHWHIEILPRTAKAAGFEWSTGVLVIAVAPEQAAIRLRAARLTEPD